MTSLSGVAITSFNILQKQQQMAKSVQTRESSYEEESQRQVYYYSKFDLFGGDNEEQFYQFSLFGERVSAELGSDWAAEAALLYYPYLSGKQVFLNLLELWLRHHPPVNSMKPAQKGSTFNSQFVSEFDALIRGPEGRLPPSATVKPAASSLRAVCLGFYMTANEIWEELFQTAPNMKQNPFSAGFLRGVTSTLEKTFKPLMVVTQKISSVFGRKRRKLNEEEPREGEGAGEGECEGEMQFEDCYPQFRRALDMEKQLERKLSDFDLEDFQMESQLKEVQKEEFKEEESPLQPSLVSNLYSYVTGFLHRNPSWQVASNFVTQILDLNQVQLAEGKKVKVLRPAQDFYRKLVIVWLLCQQNAAAVPFQDYLCVLRGSFFAEEWESRFTVPAKYFFEKLRNNWEEMRRQSGGEMGAKAQLGGFISRVEGCVSEDWHHKIAMRRC